MNYLIITCHPYEGSYNTFLTLEIQKKLQEKSHTVNIIDLVKDAFNPVMTESDLRLWGKGQSNDSLIHKYQQQIEASDVIIFPFPIWWGTMPAILKGFCDKVLLPGWAYRYGEKGEMIGELTKKNAVVITTMECPVEVFENEFKNPVDGGFIKDTLQVCGIDVIKFFQIDKIISGGREHALEKKDEILKFFE